MTVIEDELLCRSDAGAAACYIVTDSISYANAIDSLTLLITVLSFTQFAATWLEYTR